MKHVGVASLLLAIVLPSPAHAQAAMQRVSTSSIGDQGSIGFGTSGRPAISADGRHAAFESLASNLVPGDTNNQQDVFVKDRLTGTTVRVSIAWDESEGVGSPYPQAAAAPAISANGRFVAFVSCYPNLVTGDTNGLVDVFVHDRDLDQNGIFDEVGGTTTVRVSVDSFGGEGSSNLDPGPDADVAISDDGRHLAFTSLHSLVQSDTNQALDVFVHDRDADSNGVFDEVNGILTTRVSVAASGTQGLFGLCAEPSLSADGRYVAFSSSFENLVATDGNANYDCFVHDRDFDQNGVFDETAAGSTTILPVSVTPTAATGAGLSGKAVLSATGRFVAFLSSAPDLVPADTNGFYDVFIRDRDVDQDGIFDVPGSVSTTRVSISRTGAQSNGASFNASLSPNGRYVVFDSNATNLAPGDSNGARDVFVHDCATGSTIRMNVDSGGVQASGGTPYQYRANRVSDTGAVCFQSRATNLVPNDTNLAQDVFVTELFPRVSPYASGILNPSGPGGTIAVQLESPQDAYSTYVAGCALGYTTGVPIASQRLVPLDPDALLAASLDPSYSTSFVGFSGALDASGIAIALLVVPPNPALSGLTFYTAFVVVDPAAPDGIARVSNAMRVMIT
jgi:Tol biopolymer transport system component